jgi:2'-5' RNA ligase
MRVFIAVDINDQIRKAIGDLQRQLQGRVKSSGKSVRWVRPDIMHLTLKFLGEVKDDQITEVCKVVEEISGRHRDFELDVEAVGCFGGKSARVVWVGTGAGSEQLIRLAEDIDNELGEIGFAKETRRFTGHLTLCRIKNVRDGYELAGAVDGLGPFSAGTTSIDAVTVYQSELTRAGPVYTALASYKLQQLSAPPHRASTADK